MTRENQIKSAYRLTGGHASFYDGMMTYSTLPGKAICRLVWNMDGEKNLRYLEQALSGVPEDFSGFERGCGGYGINVFIGKRRPDGWSNEDFASGFPLHAVDDPANTIMFADSAAPCRKDGNWATISSMDFLGYSSSVESPDAWMTPTMHFRHNKNANAVFCDGHVDSLAMGDSSGGHEEYFMAFPCKDDTEGKNKYFHPLQ